MYLRIVTICLILGLSATLELQAQELECDNKYCRSNLHPMPEGGLWINRDESGTGFTLNVQNGILVGLWFGYDSVGEPAWYIFTGELEPIELESGGWRLLADLLRVNGGNCIGCEYEPPDDPEIAGTIEVEFPDRTHARFRVDSGAWKELMAYTYGVDAREVFEDSGHLVPDMRGWWTLVYHDRELEVSRNWRWATVSTEVLVTGGLEQQDRFGASFSQVSGIEHLPVGRIDCEGAENDVGGVCEIRLEAGAELRINSSNAADKVFFMPVSNLSESYFFARTPEGDTLEGFRTSYPLPLGRGE